MKVYGNILAIILWLLFSTGPLCPELYASETQTFSSPVVDIDANLKRLIAEEDTDDDRKITVDDACSEDHGRGDRRFWLTAKDGRAYEVSGIYHLSNLLQELKTAQEEGQKRIHFERIFENPVRRTTRLIHDKYWNGLTRRIDGPNLKEILGDEKYISDGNNFLYIPATDSIAFDYFAKVAKQQPDLEAQGCTVAGEDNTGLYCGRTDR